MQTTSTLRAGKLAKLTRMAAKLHSHIDAAGLESAAAVIAPVGGGQTCIGVLDLVGASSEAPSYLEQATKFFGGADEDAKEALLGLAAQGLLKASILAFITKARGVTTAEGSAESAEIEARLKAGDALKDVPESWTVFFVERDGGDIVAFRLEDGKWNAGVLGSITAVAEGDSSTAFDLPGALKALSTAIDTGEDALLDDIVLAMNGDEVSGSDAYRAKMKETVKRLKAEGIDSLSPEGEKVTNGPRIEIAGIHAAGKGSEGPTLTWMSGGKRHTLLLDPEDVANLLTDIIRAAKDMPRELIPALIVSTGKLMDEMPPVPPHLHKFVPESMKARLGIKQEDAPEGEAKSPEERLVEAIFGANKPGKSDDAEAPAENA